MMDFLAFPGGRWRAHATSLRSHRHTRATSGGRRPALTSAGCTRNCGLRSVGGNVKSIIIVTMAASGISAPTGSAPQRVESGRKIRPVSPRLLRALDDLAVSWRERGVRLFIFGSLARTLPASFVGADLDLGYEFSGPDALPAELKRELEQAVHGLPTIRPIDLVDAASVNPSFFAQMSASRVDLPVSSV